jgi:hypothetical protein
MVAIAAGILVAVLGIVRPATTAQNDENAPAAAAAVVGTGITYQGYLDDGGSPANGFYDFQFSLYDAAAAGVQVGSTLSLNGIAVFNGLFTVEIDFGANAFGGGARWLQIGVRPAGGGAYTTLSPRQELSPAPSALSLPNVYSNESQNFVGVGRNFRISGNEVFGVRYNGVANDYGGMYVETSHANGWPFYGYATNGSFRAWTYYNGATSDWFLYNAGIRLHVPNEGGLRIGPSADYSLVISNTTGADGIRIYDTGDDGIQIGSDPNYPNYGVYMPSPGVATYGLWPNTADAAGNYALFTVDNIQAGNVSASALLLIAQVTGSEALQAGDVVAAAGVTDPLPGAQSRLPLVRPADGVQFSGVIGVVESRLIWAEAPGKEGEDAMTLQRAEGPAQPGEYVSLVISGVAEVRVEVGAAIAAGERLTLAEAGGQLRALQTRTVEGMVVSEGAQVIGIALEAPAAGRETIPVFVTLR